MYLTYAIFFESFIILGESEDNPYVFQINLRLDQSTFLTDGQLSPIYRDDFRSPLISSAKAFGR
jgi:hypothetical protein